MSQDQTSEKDDLGPTLELLNRVLPCNPPWGPGQYVNVERIGLLLAAERERWEKAAELAVQELSHCAEWTAAGQAFKALRDVLNAPNVRANLDPTA